MLRRFVRWFWPRRALFTAAVICACVLGTLGLEHDIWALRVLSTFLAVSSSVLMTETSDRRRKARERKLNRR
ncbi:hypothetical protein L6E12_09515 [Actinokineospora sp. PR83]|uniref:hypothetical protein n=1 Tax=Actinokineospora sp. PR83 TaxID=2884908 RepID=UPI001F412C72|nr:hypothetical protein [Actinokineospora sp. PR83]MCG8916026.1 hypothetical protein [Actinokineospora sp. PR83]